MVKITLDLETQYHNELKRLATKNKRSMKNELLMIVEDSLSNGLENELYINREGSKSSNKYSHVEPIFVQKGE